MAEIGDTVKAAVLPNTPNALSTGRRCAQQGFSFVWRPWEAKPEIWSLDGTPIECTTDEHFVPIVRQDQAATEGGNCCGVGCCKFRRHFSHQ